MDDDFSDSEQQNAAGGSANDEQQDEQHAQKVNGQMEVLRMQNAELRRELKAEKAAVAKLTSELINAKQRESSSFSSSSSGDANDNRENALVNASSGLSPELRHEFFSYSLQNHALGVTVQEESEVTTEMCIILLHASTKMMKASHPGSRGTTSGTVGARMGTSGSHSHHKGSEREQALVVRIKDLESELKLALGAAEDIRALKAKLLQLVERVRIEKENKLRADAELALTTKKMHMLSDHLEKLMTHLKHEAASKIRAVEQLRLADKEMAKVKERSEIISRKSSAKDRLVLELREGCKILEDQLRLMDEKYLELRTKLDWARENSEKKVRAAVAKAKELRVKFAMMGNTTPLDKMPMPLPDIYGAQSYTSESDGYEGSMVSRQLVSSGQSYGKAPPGPQQQQQQQQQPGRRNSHNSQSLSSLNGEDEPNLDQVLEKIRKKTGGKINWDDDKLRNLSKSR